MTIYYEGWKEKGYACGECDWKGSGADCSYGRLHRQMFLDLNCPSCMAFLDLIIFQDPATIEKDVTKLTDEQKKALQEQQEQMRLHRESTLQAADQLPEIEDADFTLVWDQVEGETQIKKGDTVIWSEPLAYEGFDRYERVALILKEKYGSRVTDLAPTDRSLLFLHGDYAPSIDYIKKVRKELFGIQ